MAGLLTGWGLASAALYYDGQQPINVVNAVLVLVLPQVLLLVVWLLTALPVRLPLFGRSGRIARVSSTRDGSTGQTGQPVRQTR